VPVIIDDNGKDYKTIWYAGLICSLVEEPEVVRPSLDWLIIDVTNSKEKEKKGL